MILVRPCIYYSKKNNGHCTKSIKFWGKKKSQVFYQTIWMQVTKFFVSYVNNKILKQIIERGFCRDYIPNFFCRKYLFDIQGNRIESCFDWVRGRPAKQLWERDGSFQADTIDGRRRGRVRETNWIRIIQLDLEIGVIPEKTIIHIQRERERGRRKKWSFGFSIQKNIPMPAYDSCGAGSIFITDTSC